MNCASYNIWFKTPLFYQCQYLCSFSQSVPRNTGTAESPSLSSDIQCFLGGTHTGRSPLQSNALMWCWVFSIMLNKNTVGISPTVTVSLSHTHTHTVTAAWTGKDAAYEPTPLKHIRDGETHAVRRSALSEAYTVCGVQGCLIWIAVQGGKLVQSHQRPQKGHRKPVIFVHTPTDCIYQPNNTVPSCLYPKEKEWTQWSAIFKASHRDPKPRLDYKLGSCLQAPNCQRPLKAIVLLRMNRLHIIWLTLAKQVFHYLTP